MGQVLIRNLDDDVIAAYREAAKRNQRSLEAELREKLTMFRPITRPSRDDLLAMSARLRAKTVPYEGERPTGTELIRQARDGDREA